MTSPSKSSVFSPLTDYSRGSSQHGPHYTDLVKSIKFNLEHEHEWTDVKIHHVSPVNNVDLLPRPLISGIPHTRIYVHPDDQNDALASEKRGEAVVEKIDREWVLPAHMREKWSLKRFAECFDAVGQEPPEGDEDPRSVETSSLQKRRGGKRMLLAILNDDSTVVYYIVHDGIVKPRQN